MARAGRHPPGRPSPGLYPPRLTTTPVPSVTPIFDWSYLPSVDTWSPHERWRTGDMPRTGPHPLLFAAIKIKPLKFRFFQVVPCATPPADFARCEPSLNAMRRLSPPLLAEQQAVALSAEISRLRRCPWARVAGVCSGICMRCDQVAWLSDATDLFRREFL